MKIKLNVLLGKTEYLAKIYATLLKEYTHFFKVAQGAFQGLRKTYVPREGTIDEPSKRGFVSVQTTVSEKLQWFLQNSEEYIDSLFAVEATNASGLAKAELVVMGNSWGTFTSLELLRLKSLLESTDFRNMVENLPVRSDSETWIKSDEDMYSGRDIYETPIVEGVSKTTTKESYILLDPNIGKLADQSSYVPQTGLKHTIEELGDYTLQGFTGQASQREKAIILKNRSTLLVAVIGALKECNEVEVVKSKLTSEKIFTFLFAKQA